MNMPIRPSAATITLKAMSKLPARLIGGTAIDVTAEGIDYRIDVDIEKLPELPPGSNAGKFTLVWDEVTHAYQRVEFTQLPPPIVDWNLITGKPVTFPPDAHTHPISDVVGLQTSLDSKIGEAPNDGGFYFRHSLGWSAYVDAPADNQNYARRNNSWNLISGGGGIPDAPVDGTTYGRLNAAWTAVVNEAPIDGVAYNRKNGGWVATGGLAEAPNDGKQYSRMSLGWHDLTTDLNAKQSTSEKGANNGYASLDSSGKLPASQFPTIPNNAINSAAQIADGTITGADLATNTVLYGNMAGSAIATAAEYRSAAAQKLLAADAVWSAAAFVALTSGTTVTPDFSAGINFSLAAGSANFTLANPTNQKAGQSGVIEITQDATPRTIAFGSNWKFPGGTAPSLTTTASRVDLLYYVVKASGTIHAQMVKDSR